MDWCVRGRYGFEPCPRTTPRPRSRAPRPTTPTTARGTASPPSSTSRVDSTSTAVRACSTSAVGPVRSRSRSRHTRGPSSGWTRTRRCSGKPRRAPNALDGRTLTGSSARTPNWRGSRAPSTSSRWGARFTGWTRHEPSNGSTNSPVLGAVSRSSPTASGSRAGRRSGRTRSTRSSASTSRTSPNEPAPIEYDDPWDELVTEFGFAVVETATFGFERAWDVDSVVGYVFSLSFCSPATVGNEKEAFEAALRDRLDGFDEPFVQDAVVTVIAGRK